MKPFVLMLMAISGPVFGAEPEWASLAYEHFQDLKPLTGDWSVVDAALVGRAPAGGMAWIISAQEYADFELEVEFKTPIPCNGGVQMRSHWLPKLPAEQGVPLADLPKQMYGYQVNIETREKDGTASIIDENGRGRLVLPSPEAQEAVKPTDWNTLRITAVGFVFEVWVNGVLANRLFDERMTTGHVALQVMPFKGQDGAEIHYRNLRIRDYGRVGAWRPLFDGVSLDGWEEWGTEKWSVENGAILGRSGPAESEGYLLTKDSWKDFHVRAAFKMVGEGNYGLFYHSKVHYDAERYPRISGVQAEVMPGCPANTGRHYESYRRGWLTPPDVTDIGSWALREGEWNEIKVRCIGNRVTSWVNGLQVADFHDDHPQVFEGGIAFQLHSGGVGGIDWKDIFVLDLGEH